MYPPPPLNPKIFETRQLDHDHSELLEYPPCNRVGRTGPGMKAALLWFLALIILGVSRNRGGKRGRKCRGTAQWHARIYGQISRRHTHISEARCGAPGNRPDFNPGQRLCTCQLIWCADGSMCEDGCVPRKADACVP